MEHDAKATGEAVRCRVLAAARADQIFNRLAKLLYE